MILAPNFKLPNQDGVMLTLDDYRPQKVVLYFYPKDDTPGCTKQACAFRDYNKILKEMHVVVLGISPDSVASHKKFYDKYDLNFDLLSDEDGSVHKAYGVEKKLLGYERTTFVIDAMGEIILRMDNVNAKENPKEIYDFINSL